MMEITKVAQGTEYEMNPSAGYEEGTTATILTATDGDTLTLEITEYRGRGPDEMQYYSSLRIDNSEDEISRYLDVDWIEED